MGESNCLRQSDLRAVYRLVGEVREEGADMVLWRRRLMQGLDELLGDHVVIHGEGVWQSPALPVQPRLTLDLAWESESAQKVFYRFMKDLGPAGDPVWQAFLAEFQLPLSTTMRRQVLDDSDHYNSLCYNEYKKRGYVDDTIVSLGILPDSTYDIITVHRRLNDKQWTERDVKLLDLLHAEILPMIGSELATAKDHDVSPLLPRVEQTLDALLEGLDEKQIAARMGLSQHTVHQYVKNLYRRYRVSSRAELLALWIRRKNRDAFQRPPLGGVQKHR